MKRLPSLDGLRGLAIVLVMFQHLRNFAQGWIGVDIFFVLSGYLITSILLQERQDVHFWKVFYIRRVTRILPAFFLLLGLATLTNNVNWHVLWPWVLFSGTNFAFFSHPVEITASGLGILWSLCVEEHFYFVWPVQVRKLSRRTLVAVLMGIIVIDPVVRAIFALRGANWTVTYFITPFRIDGLAMGALLALTLRHEGARKQLERVLPITLLVGVLVLAVTFPMLTPLKFPVYCNAFALSAIAATSSLTIAAIVLRPGNLLERLFSLQPLPFLGRVSYGLYLFHQIVLETLRTFALRNGYAHMDRITFAAALLAIGFSWLSFRFFESIFLTWGRRKARAYREEEAVLAQVRFPA